MDFVRSLLEHQPLTAFFLSIALGYLVGQFSFKGFSLGVGAVLFVAIGMGWFAPKSAPAPMLGTFGLALFLYTVGIQYGRQFFQGVTSASGLKANVLALIGVTTAGLTCLLFIKALSLNTGYALGLFAGSSTSTPALQAAITALGNDDPAVGYSVSYPFGVAGPILFLYLTSALAKPRVEASAASGLELLDVALKGSDWSGRTISELTASLPPGVQIAAVRRADRNQPAQPHAVLAEDDVLLVVAPSRALLDEVCTRFGEVGTGDLTRDRRDIDYLRVFVSSRTPVGRSLGDLTLPGDRPSSIVHVRRGDADILPRPDLVLEYGDRVGLFAHRDDFPVLRQFFGDSIRGTAEFSYISIGLGMALGLLLGAIALPIPGVGTVSLGVSGVLVVALVLGHRRRTAGLTWTLPASANLVLRNLGLTMFLAQVGMASGPKFASAVADTGLTMLGLGAIVLVALVLPILILGLYVFRMSFDDVAGIVSGACGNAAILAFASKVVPSDRPDVAYAMIFPGMTLVKILFVSVIPAII